jgi:hypothetical protein
MWTIGREIQFIDTIIGIASKFCGSGRFVHLFGGFLNLIYLLTGSVDHNLKIFTSSLCVRPTTKSELDCCNL